MRYYQRSEAVNGIRSFHESRGQGSCGVSRRTQAPRSGIRAYARKAEARSSAKGQTFDFGPRGKVLERFGGRFAHLAGQLSIGKPLAHNLPHQIAESIPVIHRQAVIESKRLFIDVSEQVERFD